MKRAVMISVLAAMAMTAGTVLPARASTLAWEDPAGDATAIGFEQVPGGETSPRPSDPELDIRTVGFALQGDSIVATTKMEAGGFPKASGGSVWRFYFSHKQDQYFFQALAATAEYSQVFLSTPRFYRVTPDDPDPTSNGEELRCDCKMAVNVDQGTVQFTIKVSSVAKPLKVAPGAVELSKLELRTYRRAQWYLLSDIARAPESSKFRA